MKTPLLIFLNFLAASVSAQNPVIEGDLVICPNGSGTATVVNDVAYDSYAWYYKYWFTGDDFTLIEGATGPTFTYDWQTFDQALIKVVGTVDGAEFESNTLQIDSWAFLPITFGYGEFENVSQNPQNGNAMLCAGTSFTIEVFMPYNSNIRWYRNGVLIPGENQMTLEVFEPGVYHVTAAPEACPDFEGNTAGTPITVEINEDCNLFAPTNEIQEFAVWPNPARNIIHIQPAVGEITIYDASGRKIRPSENATATIDVSGLSQGIYLLEVTAQGRKSVKRMAIY